MSNPPLPHPPALDFALSPPSSSSSPSPSSNIEAPTSSMICCIFSMALKADLRQDRLNMSAQTKFEQFISNELHKHRDPSIHPSVYVPLYNPSSSSSSFS